MQKMASIESCIHYIMQAAPLECGVNTAANIAFLADSIHTSISGQPLTGGFWLKNPNGTVSAIRQEKPEQPLPGALQSAFLILPEASIPAAPANDPGLEPEQVRFLNAVLDDLIEQVPLQKAFASDLKPSLTADNFSSHIHGLVTNDPFAGATFGRKSDDVDEKIPAHEAYREIRFSDLYGSGVGHFDREAADAWFAKVVSVNTDARHNRDVEAFAVQAAFKHDPRKPLETADDDALRAKLLDGGVPASLFKRNR